MLSGLATPAVQRRAAAPSEHARQEAADVEAQELLFLSSSRSVPLRVHTHAHTHTHTSHTHARTHTHTHTRQFHHS